MSSGNIEELKKIACGAIDAERGSLQAVSNKIWEKPELAYDEHTAHQLLTDYLDQHGFKTEKHYHLKTAFRTEVGDNTGGKPHVGVMCEYDALPEIGHACGHNLIAEVGIAAGIGLKAALESSSGKNLGKATILGCPAEEAGGGKIDLIKAGAYKDMDIAMMAHPSNFTASATQILAMTEVIVTYKGKASHAAGFPWEGINALDAVVMAYNNVSVLRQQMKPTWRVHGIITNGGAKPNIIPEEAQLHYYIRAPKAGELNLLIEKMKACFESAATATGCQVEYKWDPQPYTNMLCNQHLLQTYIHNSHNLGVEFCHDEAILSLPGGSTDMGNVSHEVASIHPEYYIGTRACCHSCEFTEYAGLDEAHAASIIQGKALAMTCLDVLCKPELLTKIREQFKQDIINDAKV